MPRSILIIDDDPDDTALIKRALLSLGPESPVHTVNSGKALRNYLDGTDAYSDRHAFPYPELILLDLRMPEVNGFEVLGWLKRESPHAQIPVIVVSSFDRQREIRKSYELGASTFLSKPLSAATILTAVRGLMLPIKFAT